MNADRRLQIRPAKRLTQKSAKFPVHADIRVGIAERGDVSKMRAQREGHVDLSTDAFDEAADLGDVGRHIEGAIDRANDIDPRLGALFAFARLGRFAFAGGKFRPQPLQRTIGTLPLILINGARQETLNIGAFGRDPATNHLSDGAGDHNGRQVWIEHGS